jgi:putative hydrolase of HD superfamily
LPDKEVLEFLVSIRSLMTVGRFSVYKCHLREDVAQHSYFTALYAMILADLERQKGTKVEIERILRMSLLHDAEEARTGDIHHPFKHQDRAFAETLNTSALEWFKNLMSGLPESLTHEYVRLRRECEDTASLEGSIVKAADKIEALLWAYEEYLLGNEHVRRARIVEDILSKLDQIQIATVRTLISEIREKLAIMETS